MPNACTRSGRLGRRPQVGAELRLLDHEPGQEADRQRERDHPRAVPGQEHEAEIDAPGERVRVGEPRDAEALAEHALDDEREAEREQAVEVVEMIEPRQEQPLDDDSEGANDERGQHKRPNRGRRGS